MLIQLLGVSLLMVTTVTADSHYMLVIPKILRTGLNFSAELVLFENAPNEVVGTVTVRTKNDKGSDLAWTDSQMTISIAAGSRTGWNHMPIPENLGAGYRYYVFVEFEGLIVAETDPQEVESSRMAPSLFIQTDKPIYKPSDTVRFRVLALDKDLKTLQKMVTVQIKDPSGDVIMKKISKGSADDQVFPLIENEFLIDRDPKLGDYQISASYSTEQVVAQFKVDKYVLPKFDVSIKLDRNYGVSGSNEVVNVKVTAKYSYGEMVKGRLEIKSNGNSKVAIDDFDGTYSYDVPVETGMNDDFFRSMYMYHSTMSISAKVTERLTGNEMEDSTSFTIYPTYFTATIVEPLPVHFKGTSLYSFSVELTDPLGNEIPDWDTNVANSNNLELYKLVYSYQNMQPVEIIPTDKIVTVEVTLDSGDSYPNIDVWFVYERTASPRVKVKPPTYHTAANTSLEVTLVSQTTNEACFAVTPYNTGDVVYYQIMDNYYASDLMSYVHNPTKGGQCFSIDKDNAPLSMVIAYKVETVTPADIKEPVDSLITANLLIEVPWATAMQVSLAISPETVEPGDTVDITIQAEEKTYVALTGIDESLTYLGNPIEITEAKLRQSVEMFRLFHLPETTSDNPFEPIRGGGGGGPIIMEKRKKRCSACWQQDQYIDALTLLEASGVKIITNLYIYREKLDERQEYYWLEDDVMAMAGGAEPPLYKDMDGAMESDIIPEGMLPQEKPKVRSDFREVWLWNLEFLDNTDTKTIQKKVPDVITNWIVSGFAFNDIKGAGVANKAEVTVFKDFFLSMNLPYSVVRDELFSLQLIINNYKTEKITVRVELFSSTNYTIVNPGSRIQVISIGGDSSAIVEVPIKMKKIGKPTIQAEATPVTGTTMSDNVIRELTVKAEGRQTRRSLPLQIQMPAAQEVYSMDISSYFQEDGMVDDSLYMMLYVTGDMMGPAIEAIGKQIKMPYGCGEQNIQSLTPGLFSAWYLQTIDRLEAELMEKVARVLSRGYSKELQYKHDDGSYSAFGAGPSLCTCGSSGQKKGSAWLTAYVLKMFSLLYIHDMTYVDFNILEQAFTFLSNQARPTCDEQYFVEEGVLIHTEMQGGSSSKFGFTAFILSALLEFKDAAVKASNPGMVQNAENVIAGATYWLANHVEDLMDTRNPYQLSTVAYALSRAEGNNDIAEQLLLEARNFLQNGPGDTPLPVSECQAKPSDYGYTECKTDDDCKRDSNSGFSRYYGEQKCCSVACAGIKACTTVNNYERSLEATNVETYGYILMTALNLELTDVAEDMKDKLLEIRDADGMFKSTQDTAVGMEAITRYSIANSNSNGGDFSIRAIVDNTMMSDSIIISNDNYTVNTAVELPLSGKPSSVKIEVLKGISGTAFINLETVYNVDSNITDQPLDLVVMPKVTKDGRSVIESCVMRNNESNIELGTMVVIKTQLPSGKEYVDYVQYTDEKTAAMKVEVEGEGSVISAYFMDPDGFTTQRCLQVIYEEQFAVNDLKPAPVIAMDYYNPANNAEMLYSTEQAVKECVDCPTEGSSMVHCSTTLIILTFLCLILFFKM